MITTSALHEEILTIAINGHIDSSKVDMLQEELDAAIAKHRDEMKNLVLDAEEVSFISSLGLRCILQLRKAWPEISVINCCPAVYNVFKMTGFTRIINVAKALPRIADDELQKVEGMDDVFRVSEETMVRLFPKHYTLRDVEREVLLSRDIFIWGVPTVMSFDIVRARGCYAMVFESITQKDIDAKALGELLRSFHQHIVEPEVQIPSAIEQGKEWVKGKAEEYGSERVSKMLQVLNTIPDGSALLHGNLTMQKIAFSENGNKPVVTDLSAVCFGNPVIDVTHLYRSLPEATRGDYFDAFLKAYYDSEAESTIGNNKQNIVTLAKAYDCFENGVMDCWDEIFSGLHFKMDFAERIRELERQQFYLDSDVNIDWVANSLGTNRHYVSDYFNKVLHVSFSEYINNLRLEHAVSLIRSGRVSRSQVSYSSGFNNDHTFRRLFKQKYGCTPSQFK